MLLVEIGREGTERTYEPEVPLVEVEGARVLRRAVYLPVLERSAVGRDGFQCHRTVAAQRRGNLYPAVGGPEIRAHHVAA